MRIGEVAEKTGLSISNIRFYEKKGLVGPSRDLDSRYRQYTDQDLNCIKRIILLRKMDLSVDSIGKIFQNEITMEDALEQQLIDLKNKQLSIQGSIDLCQKIIEDHAYDEIDLDYYNEYVKEEESRGVRFISVNDFIDDFADVTNYNGMLGWYYFSNPLANKILKTVWCAIYLLLPVAGLILAVCFGNGINYLEIFFWLTWIMLYAFSLLTIQRFKR
jgi:DNA-binding transcriptional MerR regulator